MKKGLLILFYFPLIVFASFPVLENTRTSYNDPCDNIILKNGQEISAKVIEITPELIKYKRCDNLEGPLISIYKDEVLMLRYSNGSKDIFSISEERSNQKKGSFWGSIFSIICAHLALVIWIASPAELTFILFFALVAILFGTSSFSKRLWGLGLAGTLIGALVFFLTIMY